MKNFFLLATFLFLFSSSATIYSTNNTNKDSQGAAFSEMDYDDFDDYDSLVEEALESNVLSKEIEIKESSRFEILMKKIGIFLFLRPYIFVVTKYRCVKKLISTYVQKFVSYFSKNEIEADEQI